MATSPVYQVLSTGILLTRVLHGADIQVIAFISRQRSTIAGSIGRITILARANFSIVTGLGSTRLAITLTIAHLIAIT
jgi:hypothetical protein